MNLLRRAYPTGTSIDRSEKARNKKMMRLMKQASQQLSFSNRQVSDEACLKRNRKLINNYIRRIGRKANLSLDAQGFCYIPFKKFLIIIEVPDDQAGLVYFTTMIFDLHESQGLTKVRKRVAAMQFRDIHLGKRGSTLSLDGDEVNLSLSTQIQGLKFNEMVDCLEDFMQTAVDTNADLGSLR
jgi:hypothetical protein